MQLFITTCLLLQVFEKLKYMSIEGSKDLTKTPDFSRATNLKELIFDGCTQLYKIHSSLEYLDKLTKLSFEDCKNLECFPSIDQLVSLESLNLSGCSKLEKFPDISRHMPCLSELNLDETAITELPSSIGHATRLAQLSLENCINLKCFPSIDQLVSLESLILSGCSKLEKFPDISRHMPCLSKLYLKGTAIIELPASIGHATRLAQLSLENCINLKCFPSIDKLVSLESLNLSGCSKLEKFPDISRHVPCLSELNLDGTAIIELSASIGYATRLVLLTLRNCINFKHFPSIDQFESLEILDLSDCSKLEKFPDILQYMPRLSKLHLKGTAITELPASNVHATRLAQLSLENCINLKRFPGIDKLESLEILNLSGCSKLENFPDFSNMPCLLQLYLDATVTTELPSFATQLVRLNLTECGNLLSLPRSICKLTRLEILSLSGCLNLGKCEKAKSGNIDALPRLDQLCNLRRLELQNCRSLSTLPALPSSLELVNASNCISLEHISPQSVLFFGGSRLFANCTELREYPNTIERDLLSMATHADKERWRSSYDQVSSLWFHIMISIIQMSLKKITILVIYVPLEHISFKNRIK